MASDTPTTEQFDIGNGTWSLQTPLITGRCFQQAPALFLATPLRAISLQVPIDEWDRRQTQLTAIPICLHACTRRMLTKGPIKFHNQTWGLLTAILLLFHLQAGLYTGSSLFMKGTDMIFESLPAGRTPSEVITDCEVHKIRCLNFPCRQDFQAVELVDGSILVAGGTSKSYLISHLHHTGLQTVGM